MINIKLIKNKLKNITLSLDNKINLSSIVDENDEEIDDFIYDSYVSTCINNDGIIIIKDEDNNILEESGGDQHGMINENFNNFTKLLKWLCNKHSDVDKFIIEYHG